MIKIDAAEEEISSSILSKDEAYITHDAPWLQTVLLEIQVSG